MVQQVKASIVLCHHLYRLYSIDLERRLSMTAGTTHSVGLMTIKQPSAWTTHSVGPPQYLGIEEDVYYLSRAARTTHSVGPVANIVHQGGTSHSEGPVQQNETNAW